MPRSDVSRLIGDLGRHVAKACRLAAAEVSAALIEATPVRTGWARANWVTSVGKPTDAPVGSPEDVGAAVAAQDASIAAMSAYAPAQGPIFISNHVPYIQALDGGSSDQAPSGFVATAVDEGLSAAEAKLR